MLPFFLGFFDDEFLGMASICCPHSAPCGQQNEVIIYSRTKNNFKRRKRRKRKREPKDSL